MKDISIDIETYSSANLAKCGVYKYSESPDFEILLFGYSVDGGEVQVADIASGDEIPSDVRDALSDPSVRKHAYNAIFERVCLSRWLGKWLKPEGWLCTMVWAATLGLPFSLADVGKVLRLEEQKMTEGKALIRLFCTPNKEEHRTPISGNAEKWQIFKKYNKRDVETEMAIQARLSAFPLSDSEWRNYWLDQEINDRGILVDRQLATQAISLDEKLGADNLRRAQELTHLENPNSPIQLKEWLASNGAKVDSLSKDEVKRLINETSGDVREVLMLRQRLAKSSVKKYAAMLNVMGNDGRARGLFQFYGANRTGRFSGRLIQLQNLPQNHLPDLAEARALVRSGDIEAVTMLYDNPNDVLSQLIRTAFIPREGCRYIVADFSAIEARVIAWIAGESWRQKVFADGGDIYCASASKMFKVPVVKHGINGHLRQKGKVAELACVAEGSLVLTDVGLVPIERVTKKMLVWDGIEWVHHDGVICKGEKEVMTYDGLTATPDHLVYVQGEHLPLRFEKSAARCAHLVRSEHRGKAVRLGKDFILREALEQENESLLRPYAVPRLRKHTMAELRQFEKWEVKRMSEMLKPKAYPFVAGKAPHGGKAEMRESQRPTVSELRGKRDKILFSINNGRRTVDIEECAKCEQGEGNRQNQQRWELRGRKPEVRDPLGKYGEPSNKCDTVIPTGRVALCSVYCDGYALGGDEQKRNHQISTACREGKAKMLETHRGKVRVYDIRNAGPRHRYTVSGVLVHNCGYGGSVNALKRMGALDSGLKEDELAGLINDWRNSNPNIVRLWYDIESAAINCVKTRSETDTHGVYFIYSKGILFMYLPSGRPIAYVRPRLSVNRFGRECISYEGIGLDKKWERNETYGGKGVENLVQGTARDILVEAMQRLNARGLKIVMHVHDEVIIEAPIGTSSVEEVCRIMSETPSWAEGLLLNADGYECNFYKKE